MGGREGCKERKEVGRKRKGGRGEGERGREGEEGREGARRGKEKGKGREAGREKKDFKAMYSLQEKKRTFHTATKHYSSALLFNIQA